MALWKAGPRFTRRYTLSGHRDPQYLDAGTALWIAVTTGSTTCDRNKDTKLNSGEAARRDLAPVKSVSRERELKRGLCVRAHTDGMESMQNKEKEVSNGHNQNPAGDEISKHLRKCQGTKSHGHSS